jgi:5'-nucleotidase
LADLVQPFVLLDAGGLRVGVIGVGNASSVGLLKARPNAAAVLAEDAAQAVQGALDLLRPVADVVVALTHLGLDADHALVRATSGLDAVLGGHQHIALDEPDWEADCAGSANGTVRDAWGGERRCVTRRVPIVHSGAYGKFVGRLALELDDAPERLGADYDPLDAFEVTAVSFELLPVRADTPDDPGVAELLEPYRPPFADALGLDEVVAFVPDLVERYGATGADSPLGNLAAEAVRAAAGSDLAVIGASSLRHDLPPGLLDLEGLVRVLPFEDPIVSAELPGRTVARAFEHAARSASGRECRSQVHVAGALVRFTCPCAGNACAQVFAPETAVVCASDADCSAFSGACRGRDGEVGACYAPLDAGATYRVATTEYLAGGGSGLFDPIPVTARTRRDEPLSGAVAELVRGEASCAKGEGSADIERCADALAERAERACSARGLADGCGGAASLRARALEACRYVPCLDRALGAARDGRIRFEVP